MTAKSSSKYTPVMVEKMREVYRPDSTESERETQIAALAEEFGLPAKSIRAKLVNLKLYVKKAYKTKTGGKPETKEDIVTEIATILGVDPDVSLSGLEKATKNCLTLIRGTFRAFAKEADEE